MAWLQSPVIGSSITATFGESGPSWTGTHTGLDFAAPTGTPIMAVASGRVVQAGWFSNAYGNMVTIAHGGGVETRYAHMSRVGADVGDSVGKGSIIGNVGTTGNTTGAHTHLEVRVDGQLRDPATFLGRDADGVSSAGGFDIPTGDELRNSFTRIGLFVGGLGLMIVGVYAARRSGVL